MSINIFIASAIAILLIGWSIIKTHRIKRHYIGLIEEQKKTLTAEALNDQWWLDKTHVYITTIFGNHTKSLALPMYGTFYKLEPDITKARYSVDRLNQLFDVYVDMINKGIYYKKNILSNYNDPQIILAFLGIVATIIISISEMYYNNGYSAGQSYIECRVLESDREKQKLIDSVSMMSQGKMKIEDCENKNKALIVVNDSLNKLIRSRKIH